MPTEIHESSLDPRVIGAQVDTGAGVGLSRQTSEESVEDMYAVHRAHNDASRNLEKAILDLYFEAKNAATPNVVAALNTALIKTKENSILEKRTAARTAVTNLIQTEIDTLNDLGVLTEKLHHRVKESSGTDQTVLGKAREALQRAATLEKEREREAATANDNICNLTSHDKLIITAELCQLFADIVPSKYKIANGQKKPLTLYDKTIDLLFANSHDSFDMAIEKRKLIVRPIIEIFQDDLVQIDSINNFNDRLLKTKELTENISDLKNYLEASNKALDFESKRSKGELTGFRKDIFQGDENFRGIALRSGALSLANVFISGLFQEATYQLKLKLYQENRNLLSDVQLKEAFNNSEEFIRTNCADSIAMNTGEAEAAIDSLCKDLQVSFDQSIQENAALSAEEFKKSLNDIPNSINFREKIQNILNTFEKHDNDIDVDQIVKDVVAYSSAYFDTAGMTPINTLALEASIGAVRGVISPVIDSIYEKNLRVRDTSFIIEQDLETGNQSTFCKRNIDTLQKNVENFTKTNFYHSWFSQLLGAVCTLFVIQLARLLTSNSDDIKKKIYNDLVFIIGIVPFATAVIDSVRSCEVFEEHTQSAKFIGRIIGRLAVQSSKILLEKGELTPIDGVDIGGIGFLTGFSKELLGTWMVTSVNDEGCLSSHLGVSAKKEKKFFQDLEVKKKHRDTTDEQKAVLTYVLFRNNEILQNVKAKMNYINQIGGLTITKELERQIIDKSDELNAGFFRVLDHSYLGKCAIVEKGLEKRLNQLLEAKKKPGGTKFDRWTSAGVERNNPNAAASSTSQPPGSSRRNGNIVSMSI